MFLSLFSVPYWSEISTKRTRGKPSAFGLEIQVGALPFDEFIQNTCFSRFLTIDPPLINVLYFRIEL